MKCDVSWFFRCFERKFRCERVLRFLENVAEKAGARVNNCKFAKDSSIPATLFTDKAHECMEK